MNMIEKVARAIATADEQNGGPPYEMLMTMGKHVREGLYDRAKAAIEAMREPTPKMLDVGDEAMTSTGFSRHVYSRMIESALEGI